MTVADDMYKPEKTIAIKVSDENLAPEIASGDIIISCYKVSQQNSNLPGSNNSTEIFTWVMNVEQNCDNSWNIYQYSLRNTDNIRLYS